MNKRHTNKPERTRRRMTLHSSFFILSSSLIMLLAACTNDPSEDILSNVPGNSDLPQGTFVIDYTASTGDTRTRLAASERIQSLDYLLYEKAAGSNDFLLKHRRTIPDIGENTIWPLTRETMTWAQREALKDTLNQNSEYKMVFVANADAAIWDNTEVLQNVTEGTSTFDDGRLVLPPRLFSDNDMYYLWSNHDTPLVGSNYNKNNPASMEITLQRMINKVEVKLDANLVSTDPSTDIDSYLDKYLNEALAEGGIIFSDMQTEMQKLVENIGTTGAPQAISNFKEYITASEQISTLLSETSPYSTRADLIDKFKRQMKETELVIKKLEWNKVHQVVINYESKGRASAIDFSTQSIAATDSDIDPLPYIMDKDNRSFFYYCFGNNTNGDGLNKIQSISFQNEVGSEIFHLTGTDIAQSGKYGGNNFILLKCDPFCKINSDKTEDYTATFNFEEFVPWDDLKALADINVFKQRVRERLGDLTQVKLTFSYPCNPVITWKTEVQ